MIQGNWTRRPSAPQSSARTASLHRSLTRLSTFAVLLATTASLQAQTPTIVAGTPAGQFGVSSGGSASYTIPIPVPPGVAGMQPNLALSYNSQGGSGLLGMGWNLGGLSSITRCPRTKGQDGVRGSVNFDDNDRFCMDGQRLILVSGTYGQLEAEYRTEMEGFSQIAYNKASYYGNGRFTVWTKNGLLMEYGNTADSRIEAVKAPYTSATWPASKVRVWALNRISDAKGNYLTITYDEDTVNGVYRPARIDYAGNLVAGTPTHSSVRFSYIPLANPITKYQAGALIKQVSTLSEIAVYHGDTTVVSKTKLSYQSVGPAQTPRLSAVQQCSGTDQCLSPLSLSYAAEALGFATAATSWPLMGGASYQRQTKPMGVGSNATTVTLTSLVDMNGDGLADLVTVPADGSQAVTYLNTGSGFSTTATPLTCSGQPVGYLGEVDINGNTRIGFVDLNGDGLVDVYTTKPGENMACLNSGAVFSGTPWSIPMPNYYYQSWPYQHASTNNLQDLNGDGLPDAYAGGTVFLNSGSVFGGTALSWPLPPLVNSTSEVITPSSDPSAQASTVSLVDLNGDGLADIYVTTGTSASVVYFNTGYGFSADPVAWAIPNDPTYREVSGKAYQGFSRQWDGSDPSTRTTTQISLVDMNGDGLPDLYLTAEWPIKVSLVYFNTGNGFSNTPVSWSLPARTAYQGVLKPIQDGTAYYPNPFPMGTQASLTDLNGDGLPDLYYTSGSGINEVYFNQASQPNLLVQVSSATGPTTSISYARLTDPTVYTKDSATNAAVFPKVDLARAGSVVANVASVNGIGGTNTTNYSYGGLKFEAGTGRGTLGFRWVKSKDMNTGLERYTEYRQDFPYTGMAAKSETRLAGSGNAGVLKRSTTTPACNIPQTGVACAVAPGTTYFPHVASQIEEAWELNGTAYPSTTSSVQYTVFPHYGGPRRTIVSSTEGWSKTTVNDYWSDTWVSMDFLGANSGRIIGGLLKQSTVTSVKP